MKKNFQYVSIMKAFIISILMLLTLSSCDFFKKDNEAKQLKKMFQEFSKKELKFPDSVFVFYGKNNLLKRSIQSYTENHLKIVTRITADCHHCIINLQRWEEEILCQIDTSSVKFLSFIYTDNLSYFTDVIYPEIDINYPLLIDTLNQFVIDNNLPPFDNRFHTFLLDTKNKIILIGSPLSNNQLKNLYLDEIQKRKKF